MRGRKPTPSVIKFMRGNPGHKPLPPDEPKPKAEIPKCPAFLDPKAKKEWRRMARELADLGIITTIDRAVLAKYCEAYSQWEQASKKIQELGMVFKTPVKRKVLKDGSSVEIQGGYPVINPYFKIADNAKAQMLKCCTEMGCTPSSRARVKAIPKEKEDAETKKKNRFFK